MAKNTIHGLMKVGTSEFMQQLYNAGEIFMKELLWFRKLENDKQRSDIHEGSYMLKQIPYIKIRTAEGKEIEFSTLGKGIQLTSTAKLRGHYEDLMANIYCMYGFDTKLCSKANTVDPSIAEFGDTAILIFNPSEFLNRIQNALIKMNYKPYFRMVNYYDEESYESDNMFAFWKPRLFEPQNEFRIFIEREEYGDLSLKIGPLYDIAEIHPIDHILKKMKFEILPATKQIQFSFY